MPVDPLTKDDITKSNAALFDLMVRGRLILVDESSELDRRRAAPELKDRSQLASRRQLAQSQSMLSWQEFRDQELSQGGGGGGGPTSLLLSPSRPDGPPGLPLPSFQ
eukprot:5004083-Pyramimonas_sp.AAC.1